MSREALEAAALAYLARFATSSANLRRVLARKATRSARHYGDDPAPLLAEIDSLVARYERKGVLNDSLYAEMQLATLRRRGSSSRAIKERLAAKGVGPDAIAAVLEGVEEAAADRAGAIRLARRRRLGPYRTAGRADYRQRDLAALGRAGFAYEIARAVVDAPDAATLEESLRTCDDR